MLEILLSVSRPPSGCLFGLAMKCRNELALGLDLGVRYHDDDENEDEGDSGMMVAMVMLVWCH